MGTGSDGAALAFQNAQPRKELHWQKAQRINLQSEQKGHSVVPSLLLVCRIPRSQKAKNQGNDWPI